MISNLVSTARLHLRLYRRHWTGLVAIDLAAKAVAFIVLFPAAGVLTRILLKLSGARLVADEDIIEFLLGPAGWLILLLVVSANIAVFAVGLAAMLIYVVGAERGGRVTRLNAVVAALRRLPAIFGLVWRLLLRFAIAAIPFLVAGGAVAWLLLSEHDINYYLSRRPPEFRAAVVACAVLVACYSFVAAALAARWFLSLPLLLLHGAGPSEALAESVARTSGRRLTLALFVLSVLLVLAGTSFACSWLLTGGVALVLSFLKHVPALYVLVLGAALLAWLLVHLAMSVIGDTVLATAVAALFLQISGSEGPAVSQPGPVNSASNGWRRVPAGVCWAAAGLAVAAAGALGWYMLASVPVTESVLVLAHRAGAAAGPENTLAAIEKAIALGADYVEIDVQQTADGHIVLAHDRDLMRVADSPLVVEEATLAELKEVDVGGGFAPAFAGTRIPELKEVLACCRGRIGVAVELKHYGRPNQLEEAVVRCVEHAGMADQVLLMSLDRDSVRKLRQLRPNWRVGQLTAVAVGDLTKDDVEFLAVRSSLATSELIERAHGTGKKVFAWTIDDPALLSVLASRGVDGVITDDVKMAVAVLADRAEMSPLERLMLQAAISLGDSRAFQTGR